MIIAFASRVEIGLKPDGLVTKTESEKIEAERILKANIPETHTHKRHAISVKSLDTQTRARLIDPRQMEHLLDSYVRKVNGFRGVKETSKQYKISPEEVISTEIRVGVPKETTMEQWQVLQRSVVKAEQQGVKITFGIEK